MQDISKGLVKFVVNLGQDRMDQTKFRQTLLKTRTPELKTSLETQYVVKSFFNTKVFPSLLSLQEKKDQCFPLRILKNTHLHGKQTSPKSGIKC